MEPPAVANPSHAAVIAAIESALAAAPENHELRVHLAELLLKANRRQRLFSTRRRCWRRYRITSWRWEPHRWPPRPRDKPRSLNVTHGCEPRSKRPTRSRLATLFPLRRLPS